MSSLKKQIEDAVITILNEGTFSQEFTAVRGPRSLKKLEQTSTLQVIVAAIPTERGRLTRDKIQWKFAVGVGLFKNIGFDGNEEIEPAGVEDVDALAEEIAEAMDVTLSIDQANGPLTPEIDYEPDDGAMWNKGIAAVQINSPFNFWVPRRSA